MTSPQKILFTALAVALLAQPTIERPGFAQAVSPSPKTRTFEAPKEDYFQQVTKGHPFRWFDTDMAIRVLVKPGAGVPNFKPKFDQILRDAFQTWVENSNSKIKFQFVKEPPADITCEFVADLPRQQPSVAGVTNYQTSPHHMNSADILIRTTNKIAPLTDELMRAICLHEVGHALGLVNHSLDPHDVMFPYLSQQKTLSERDVKTIRKLYDFKPPEPILKIASKPKEDLAGPFSRVILSNEDYDLFTRAIVAKIPKQELQTANRPALECCISCLVDKSGNIFNYRIFQPSLDEGFDEQALNVLFSALPLPPAPEKLRKNKSVVKIPVALSFRSDGTVVPFIEPDARLSDWLQPLEEPSPEEMMRDLAKDKKASPKTIDPNLEPWIVSVSQKAHAAWKTEGHGKTEVVLGIRNNGRIAHLVIVDSSKDQAFDNSVLNACLSAEPYPLVPNSPNDTIEVNLLFEQ